MKLLSLGLYDWKDRSQIITCVSKETQIQIRLSLWVRIRTRIHNQIRVHIRNQVAGRNALGWW
jgi:head-tail adaptor